MAEQNSRPAGFPILPTALFPPSNALAFPLTVFSDYRWKLKPAAVRAGLAKSEAAGTIASGLRAWV